MTEIEKLREEVAKLRERIAVLEGVNRPNAVPVIDWTRPLHVGSPHFVEINPTLPPGTITCTTPTKGPTP